MPVENGSYFIYDTSLDKIVSSTEKQLYGLSNAETAVELSSPSGKQKSVSIDGKNYAYALFDYDNYRIGVCEPTSHLYRDAKQAQ